MMSEPRIPNGMSFCGFFASCAAVDTASNPMYAKNTKVAPRMIPDHPYDPNDPVFAGMNGCQFAVINAQCPNAYAVANPMKISTTETLITTTTLLKFADSFTPITRIAVITTIADMAKISMCAGIEYPKSENVIAGDGLNGILMPKYPSRLETYPLHPTATVAAPNAYSSTSAQPIIHATSSPSVA